MDRRLSRFFVLTLILTLPLYGLGLLLPQSRLPMQIPYTAIMVLCPMLAALLLWRAEGQGPARRIWRIAAPWRADTGPRGMGPRGAGLTGAAILGITLALWLAGALSPAGGATASAGTVAISLPLFLIAAIPEEIGWTAYATPAAAARHGLWRSGALIGLVWALWHWWPWLVLQGRPLAWVAGMTAIDIITRLIIVLIWAATGRGIAAAVLLHGALNAAFLLPPGEGAGLNTLMAAALLLPVLAGTAVAARAC